MGRSVARRRYDNSGREEGARETRARILRSAHDLLLDGGYPGLSIAALARAAAVSPQTIYNSIGGKADVLKACYDVTLAGDDEPVAISDRPAFRAIWATDDRRVFLDRYATWCRTVYDRVAPIVGAVTGTGAGDGGAQEFVATIDRERRIGTARAMAHFAEHFGLPPGLTLEAATDAVWTLNSPEVYDRLVRRCGWTPAGYAEWLAGQLDASLGLPSRSDGPAGPSPSRLRRPKTP